MGQYVQVVPVKFKSITVPAGTTVYLDTQSYPYPISVSAVPGAGGTVTVSRSITPDAAGKTTAATWYELTSGAVSAATLVVQTSPVAGLRFTATVSAATVEIAA